MVFNGIPYWHYGPQAFIASVYDMFVLIAISILTMVFAMSGKKIKRWEGAVMLLAYIVETVFAIMRG